MIVDGAEVSDANSRAFFGGGKYASAVEAPEQGLIATGSCKPMILVMAFRYARRAAQAFSDSSGKPFGSGFSGAGGFVLADLKLDSRNVAAEFA